MITFRFVPALACALAMAASSLAAEVKSGALHIDQARARATVSGQTSGAAYLTIENKGKSGDKLLSASSPVAGAVEIHTMSMDGNIMKMREVPELAINPLDKIVMKPGVGYHFMLIGLKQPLKTGDQFPITLTFQQSGKIEVAVRIEEFVTQSGSK